MDKTGPVLPSAARRVALLVVATCLLTAAPSASADASGIVNFSSAAGGSSWTVTANSIAFNPGFSGNCPGPSTCDFAVAPGTNMTYGPGGITAVSTAYNGTLAGESLSSPSANPFAVLYNAAGAAQIDFSLSNFVNPSPSNGTNCASVVVAGQSCVLFSGSPLLLTATGSPAQGLGTEITLSFFGQATDLTDGNALSSYTGLLVSEIGILSPAEMQSFFCPGGACDGASISTTYSGNLNATPIPEPSSLVLMGSGALGLFGALRRRFLV